MTKITIQKNKVYIQPNVDKVLHQKWDDSDHSAKNLINIPRPYSCLLTAQPGCGKTNIIKNILAHMSPIPDNIFICHAECWDADACADPNEPDSYLNKDVKEIPEYEGIKAVYLKALPPIIFWDQFKKKHNVLVIDDVDLRSWCGRSNTRKGILDKTWSWARTHRNVTILCALQSIFQQGVPCIYRFSNVFNIWPMRDKYCQQQIGRCCGIDKDQWKELFSLCKTQYDSIMVDGTPGTPAPYRFNLGTQISFDPDNDSDSSDSDEEPECVKP